jgi:cytoskeletal protein RodZ
MSIGEVLHDARYRSGLTISDVAERTGIVEETIWAIELDDFAKCGEDFYARGYISVIAAVVRVDSAPLLAEFDAAHSPPAEDDRAVALTLPTSGPPASSPSTSGLLEPDPSGPNPPDRPRRPSRSERHKWRHRRRVTLSTALCLIVLAIFGAEAYHFAFDTGSTTASYAAYSQATVQPQTPKVEATRPVAKSSPSPAALRTLKPVSATAYGPSGPETGNPLIAAKAIDASSSTAWQSKAYGSPDFDGEQAGTGVLLDLGRPLTVVSATITIGVPGAWIEVRGGTSDSPSALSVIGGTKDAGSTTTIRPQQTPIRYLVIWFTTLPQTPAGNYQATIANVTLQGHS